MWCLNSAHTAPKSTNKLYVVAIVAGGGCARPKLKNNCYPCRGVLREGENAKPEPPEIETFIN